MLKWLASWAYGIRALPEGEGTWIMDWLKTEGGNPGVDALLGHV